MLRIGIMLDSYTTTAWVAKIIEDIQRSDFAELSLVILNTPAPAVKPSFRKRLKEAWKYSLYFRYEMWDYAQAQRRAGCKKRT